MNYEITNNAGDIISLPAYTIKLAESIETVASFVDAPNNKFRDKIKKMYNFLETIIPKENIEEDIGSLNECDPNNVNLMFLKVVDAYNSPISEFNTDKISDKLDTIQIDKVVNLIESADKLSKKR